MGSHSTREINIMTEKGLISSDPAATAEHDLCNLLRREQWFHPVFLFVDQHSGVGWAGWTTDSTTDATISVYNRNFLFSVSDGFHRTALCAETAALALFLIYLHEIVCPG